MMKEKNKENNHKKFDLQECLVDYVANYREAQNAEFRSNFIYFFRQLIQ